jgi:hypothetical protein
MLGVNFHQTFIPERRLLSMLLDYASKGNRGSIQEMSEATGIPMGKSSGKMPAIINYAKGMGLIKLKGEKDIKQPILTEFGEIVNSEDRFLGEEIVQWIAHMNLCRNDIGAKTWYETFARGGSVLGKNFSKQQLEEYLNRVCGPGKGRIGPLIGTYFDDAAFKRAGCLAISGDVLLRKKAPILDAYAKAYSAYLLLLLETYFPHQSQVTLTDFNAKTFWFNICLWSETDINQFCVLLERTMYITIDRQMRPWIIEKVCTSHEAWSHFFDDIV